MKRITRFAWLAAVCGLTGCFRQQPCCQPYPYPAPTYAPTYVQPGYPQGQVVPPTYVPGQVIQQQSYAAPMNCTPCTPVESAPVAQPAY